MNHTKYIAYHISDSCFQEGLELNTNNINRSFAGNTDKDDIEQKAELARKKIALSRPSRKTCLFVCNSEHVQYWYEYYKKRAHPKIFYIHEVELDTSPFWTYADFLRDKKYEDYWDYQSGKVSNDYVEHEGLYEGKYRIVSVYSFSDFLEVKNFNNHI